jgi:hypothetical protein
MDIVTVDPGSNPDHDKLGGERGKVIVRRVKLELKLDYEQKEIRSVDNGAMHCKGADFRLL